LNSESSFCISGLKEGTWNQKTDADFEQIYPSKKYR